MNNESQAIIEQLTRNAMLGLAMALRDKHPIVVDHQPRMLECTLTMIAQTRYAQKEEPCEQQQS